MAANDAYLSLAEPSKRWCAVIVIGSGWKDYQNTGAISGIKLPAGLRQAAKLPQPIFTPSTKAATGDTTRTSPSKKPRSSSARSSRRACATTAIASNEVRGEHARERGIIIADTKFEFGVDADGELVLIDEVLTPDSSRFWPADRYRAGSSPPSFDKQFVRDYLETLDWNKQPPAPKLPPEIAKTAKYLEAPTFYREAA